MGSFFSAADSINCFDDANDTFEQIDFAGDNFDASTAFFCDVTFEAFFEEEDKGMEVDWGKPIFVAPVCLLVAVVGAAAEGREGEEADGQVEDRGVDDLE